MPVDVRARLPADAIEFQMRTFAGRADRYESVTLFKHYDFDTPFCDDFEQMFVDEGIPVEHPDVRAFIQAS